MIVVLDQIRVGSSQKLTDPAHVKDLNREAYAWSGLELRTTGWKEVCSAPSVKAGPSRVANKPSDPSDRGAT